MIPQWGIVELNINYSTIFSSGGGKGRKRERNGWRTVEIDKAGGMEEENIWKNRTKQKINISILIGRGAIASNNFWNSIGAKKQQKWIRASKSYENDINEQYNGVKVKLMKANPNKNVSE